MYGFETKANPCTNGTCDAISECIVGMQEQGKDEYGIDAYGPGGFLIDTNTNFNVRTQLLTEDNKKTFWGLRTTLTQDGRTISMQKECREYLQALKEPAASGMGIIFSSWDNRNGYHQFELDQGQTRPSSCDSSSMVFENFRITTNDSDEPAPAPAEYLPFIAYTDQSEN